MLVLKLELHSAITKEVTLLGTTIIHNTGGTKERGNYGVAVGRRGDDNLARVLGSPVREGAINNYPRLSYNVWRLVIRALLSAFPEEKVK